MITTQIDPIARQYERYRVSVKEYITFREQGFLVVRGLIPPEDVQELNAHMDNLLAGRESIQDAVVLTDIGKVSLPNNPEDWLRVHMLHRILPIHERFLLHPRTLDVLEALIGPDVLALQSMLFFKKPGQPGQGYHQDAYYIPSFHDTLCGAWLALTRADQRNGCLWMAVGSQNEPIYPDVSGHATQLQSNLEDLQPIQYPSVTDEKVNTLSRVAHQYSGSWVPVEADPGDVVLFGGHIIHWSHSNRGDQPRRSFVGHYCNARSLVPWNHGVPYEGDSANYLHVLGRGRTHLPFAQPKFGTPCAANMPQTEAGAGSVPISMMGDDDGMMASTPHAAEMDED